MHEKTLADLSKALHKREISSTELTQHFLNRIRSLDKHYNSFITVNQEAALAAAKQADTQLMSGKAGKLTGIPIAHKDIFCTKGIKTSCASKMLDNFNSPYDATLVSALHQAGTVLLGKTNMDEFAMGSSTEHSFYGPTKNPWKLSAIPGGSSGGSAASVAAGLTAAATGTDTGGSIRQPAALCGITGLKPSYGRISRFGMIAFASSLDQAGPMTKTAEDAAMMLNVMAGHDSKDSTSINRVTPDYTTSLNDDIDGLTIGLPQEYFANTLDPSIANSVHKARQTLEKLGAKVVDISLPHTQYAIPTYYVIAPAECSANLARYDGVRFGYRCDKPRDLTDLYERSRSEAFGDEVKRRILIGTYVLSSGYYDAYYLQAQKVRYLIRDDFIQAFKKVDIILTPTTPNVAHNIGDIQDPTDLYLADIYTIAVNLAGLPGLSMPAGFHQGLPIGAQLIGNYFDEARLLNVAHRYQQVTDWHLQSPPTDEKANHNV